MSRTIQIIILFTVGLVLLFLPLIYLLWLRKAKQRLESRLRIASSVTALRQRSNRRQPHRRQPRPEISHTFIGDDSCHFNARSAYIRCAVNPEGPCDTCSHYQSREQDSD